MGTGKSSNHVLDLIVLEHDSKLAITRPAVVADGNNVLRAFPRQSLNEIIRKASASESADHDFRAIRNVRHGIVETRVDLLHRAMAAPARMFGWNFAATPLARSQRPGSVRLKSCTNKARKSAESSTSISSRALRRTIISAWKFSSSASCFLNRALPNCKRNRVDGDRSTQFDAVHS